MACYAAALGIRDDDVIAVILLHYVCEDTGISPDVLPFSENIRNGTYLGLSFLLGLLWNVINIISPAEIASCEGF